jgi:Putative Flp pilus-assembly TadE/G-like
MLPNDNNSARRMFCSKVLSGQGVGAPLADGFVRDERGQILPLLAVVIILLIGAGMLVLWLGLSATITSKAQTAADAAALAGEQELVDELRIVRYGPNGQVLPPTYDPGRVCDRAAQYAHDNHGYMSCMGDIQFIPVSGLFATDVEVTVHSQQTLPSQSVDAGQGATTKARASTDPFSQDSPAISTTTTSCDASVVAGTPFDPPTHGTGPGFFAKPDADYKKNCEPKLAGKLQALAMANGLHLVGVRGYDTSAPATNISGGSQNAQADQIDAAHSCGAASTVTGVPKPGTANAITDATLKSFGLSRPFPGAPGEIELANSSGCTQDVSQSAGASQPVGFGNADVHLVALSGGPVGSLAVAPLGGITPISASGMKLGCMIWSVGQRLHVNPTVMLSAFLGAWDESSMTNITTYTPGEYDSLGMFQQRTSMGWGSPAQETNPPDAIAMYFIGDEPGSPYYNGRGSSPGAIGDYRPGIEPWALTQDVQGSRPGQFTGGANYERYMPQATTMIDQIKAGACTGP